MNSQQINGFETATQASVSFTHLFFVGLFFAVLFLWGAWVAIDAYNGLNKGTITFSKLMFLMLRVIAIILFISFFLLQ